MRAGQARVVLKARPPLGAEAQQNALGELLQVEGETKVLLHQPVPSAHNRSAAQLAKVFEVDQVYLPSDTCEQQLQQQELPRLVDGLYEGVNAVLLAYGACNTGKTHTLLGSREQPGGLVAGLLQQVFDRADADSCELSISVEELHNERFIDLLAQTDTPQSVTPHRPPSKRLSVSHDATPPPRIPANSSGSGSGRFHTPSSSGINSSRVMPLRTPGGSGTPISLSSRTPGQLQQQQQQPHTPLQQQTPQQQQKHGAQGVVATSSNEALSLILQGCSRRHTAAVPQNPATSRSHLLITLVLQQHSTPGRTQEGLQQQQQELGLAPPAEQSAAAAAEAAVETTMPPSSSNTVVGRLHIVDLASSENLRRLGGVHAQEAAYITQGLCHLKQVMEWVFRGQKVPTFRNSKLTHRLQDALGGSSRLLVLACISTATSHLTETRETLRFAEMARCVTNTPTVNITTRGEHVRSLQQQLAVQHDRLQQQQCQVQELQQLVAEQALKLYELQQQLTQQQLPGQQIAQTQQQHEQVQNTLEWDVPEEETAAMTPINRVCAGADTQPRKSNSQGGSPADTMQLLEALAAKMAAHAASVVTVAAAANSSSFDVGRLRTIATSSSTSSSSGSGGAFEQQALQRREDSFSLLSMLLPPAAEGSSNSPGHLSWSDSPEPDDPSMQSPLANKHIHDAEHAVADGHYEQDWEGQSDSEDSPAAAVSDLQTKCLVQQQQQQQHAEAEAAEAEHTGAAMPLVAADTGRLPAVLRAPLWAAAVAGGTQEPLQKSGSCSPGPVSNM